MSRMGSLAGLLNVRPSASKMVYHLRDLELVEFEKYRDSSVPPRRGRGWGSYLLLRTTCSPFSCLLNGAPEELEQVEQVEHFVSTEETVRTWSGWRTGWSGRAMKRQYGSGNSRRRERPWLPLGLVVSSSSRCSCFPSSPRREEEKPPPPRAELLLPDGLDGLRRRAGAERRGPGGV